uniref:Transposase n=1 Tax=Globodera pallida TaxID=36090 RepID=A0A183CFG9_GLOPA
MFLHFQTTYLTNFGRQINRDFKQIIRLNLSQKSKLNQTRSNFMKDGRTNLHKKESLKLNMNHIMEQLKWKEQLKLNMNRIRKIKRICHSEEEKLKIVNKFLEMKQNLNTKVGKRSSKQIDKEMADKLGVNVRTIYQWKRDFGFSKKRLTSEEQTEIIKRFENLELLEK